MKMSELFNMFANKRVGAIKSRYTIISYVSLRKLLHDFNYNGGPDYTEEGIIILNTYGICIHTHTHTHIYIYTHTHIYCIYLYIKL